MALGIYKKAIVNGRGVRKMKVLWYSNVLLPEAADAAGIEGRN